ncbi:hypothetical protein GGD46_001826 [Rhizobium lusitanum]|uniref:Uncharacterized protein n=1 Tax=Rhizobium lusitanum TaxID=293958 RepID=A0A7X0IP38_9HYPH|nr:hypothetical protein [Rhizobium lusitanum]
MPSPVGAQLLIHDPNASPIALILPPPQQRRGDKIGVAMFLQCAYAMQAFFAQRWDIANTAA